MKRPKEPKETIEITLMQELYRETELQDLLKYGVNAVIIPAKNTQIEYKSERKDPNYAEKLGIYKSDLNKWHAYIDRELKREYPETKDLSYSTRIELAERIYG